MSIISRWRTRLAKQQTQDVIFEEKNKIRSSGKHWVTPADIEALEEEKVPWLREKRRAARRDA